MIQNCAYFSQCVRSMDGSSEKKRNLIIISSSRRAARIQLAQSARHFGLSLSLCLSLPLSLSLCLALSRALSLCCCLVPVPPLASSRLSLSSTGTLSDSLRLHPPPSLSQSLTLSRSLVLEFCSLFEVLPLPRISVWVTNLIGRVCCAFGYWV